MDLWKEHAIAFVAQEITKVRYDPYRDLVWIGDSEGRVASFYGPLLHPYTSYIAHYGAVKDIQISEKYVVSLGVDGVKSYQRNGILVASNAQATGDVLLLLDHSEFLVGFNRRVKRYTLDPQIKETGFFELDCISEKLSLTHMSLSTPNVAIGLSNGTVQVVEPHTFDPVLARPVTCHSGPLTDLDSRKSLLVTCGLSQRKYGLVPDVFVNCFDTHGRKPLAPMSVSTGASFVRLHPKSPNHAVIAGTNGQLTFLDSKNPTSLLLKQMVIQSPIIALEMGPLGDSFVVAEKCLLHFWSSNAAKSDSDSFKGLDVPTAIGRLPPVGDNTPLSAIGMPYYNQELLSSWNPSIVFETGFPTPDWESVKSPYIAQTHASTKARRYKTRRSSSVSVPRFLSEQARLRTITSDDSQVFADLVKADDSAMRGKVPKIWRQMQVHYSKFGVDDFDFSYYNATKFAGLEPLSASRRLNAILQLYRWCPAIYNTALQTFARNNRLDLTVTGELAIVLDMLTEAQGYHCRATNFMDTLQYEMNITEFHSVLSNSLVEEYEKEVDPKGKSPLRKLVKTIHVNSAHTAPSPSWGVENLRDEPSFLFVCVDETSYARRSNTLGPRIYEYFGLNKVEDDAFITTGDQSLKSYQLTGFVAEVDDEGERHAVAVIKIDGHWHLFNDFLVTPTTEEDALDFSVSWKQPCLLMYSYCGGDSSRRIGFDSTWKNQIDTTLLSERLLESGNWDDKRHSYNLLSPGEPIPESVALDAEFVLIRKEISEVHSDGSKNLVSPKKLSLARLSVLRDDETILFDDMVESKQPVVDYVTAYSGIEPGDLDPLTSRYGLVRRQTTTRKLWILIKYGTKFVGHALVNDFRTINLYVPPQQVVDTYNIFYDPDRNGMRRFSLKFLMWAVLDEQVQTGNHDSVQDAQSALRLYKKHEELESSGTLDEMLEEIAAKGQVYNYRVPIVGPPSRGGSSSGNAIDRQSTPSTPIR